MSVAGARGQVGILQCRVGPDLVEKDVDTQIRHLTLGIRADRRDLCAVYVDLDDFL